MEAKSEFLTKLEEALELRREYLDAQILPRLRDSFHAYQTALKGIISILVQKSLIDEDPYKHEKKISEVALPPTDPVIDAEKSNEISVRLSDFENQLDFLNNFYQFSSDFLNLDRVRLLSKLVNYITWDKLSELSGGVNTRIVGELITKIRLGTDKLSSGLLTDALGQIVKAKEEIITDLRELTSFHREQYKAEARAALFDGTELQQAEVQRGRDEVIRKLKARFGQLQAKGKGFRFRGFEGTPPYYPELVGEILDEDYSEYAENLKSGVLEKLAVREPVKPKRKAPPELKPLLLEGVRALSAASSPLDIVMQKLVDNSRMLDTRKITLGERFRRWLTKRIGGQKPTKVYEIEITDPNTAITSAEQLDFTEYCQRMARRARSLANLSSRLTESYAKVEALDEEKLSQFLATAIDEVHYLATKMPALETYFKSELARDERAKLRMIRIELEAIRNAVLKANQKRHEYAQRREERAQFKRLGIDADE